MFSASVYFLVIPTGIWAELMVRGLEIELHVMLL